MTDKTPPYVIDFDDIRKGMTIEREWKVGGEIRFRTEAVADHLSEGDVAWLTPDGYLVANDKGDAVLRVLAEPPAPALPTEPGAVITCSLESPGGRSRATLVRLEAGSSPDLWVGVDGGGFYRRVRVGDEHRITDWTVVYDPTAPKADDGLRERVERVLKDSEAAVTTPPSTHWQHGYCDATRDHVRRLRDVLDGSADA